MMTDYPSLYASSCGFLEPLYEFCGSYSTLQHEDDDGGTPKISNCASSKDESIPSRELNMSYSEDASSYSQQDHASTLQKVGNDHYGYDRHYDQAASLEHYPPSGHYPSSSWYPSHPTSAHPTPGSWHGHSWHPYYHQHAHHQYPGHMQHQAPPARHAEEMPTTHYKDSYQETTKTEVREDPATDFTQSVESKRDLRTLDIVCGRGAPTNFHYGNQLFRELIEQHQTSYLCAKRSDKPQIAMKLLDHVKASGGRFVRRQRTSEGLVWAEINDKGAYEKICQGLRDGAPDLRQKVLSKFKKSTKTMGGDKENNGKEV